MGPFYPIVFGSREAMAIIREKGGRRITKREEGLLKRRWFGDSVLLDEWYLEYSKIQLITSSVHDFVPKP